jgi:dissimilatory sulfite reductase (desulfoviridin) alpha/beta subunit
MFIRSRTAFWKWYCNPTTRLTIEVQGIPYDKIEDFRAYIAKEGLVTGGTGSKVRPIVSCKGTTCQYGLIDTLAISE